MMEFSDWNSASQVETLDAALKNAEGVRDEAIRHGVLHLETIATLEQKIAELMRENAKLREENAELREQREVIERYGMP